MRNLSLRTRLLISYLFLLAVALGVIAAALIVFLNARPAPPNPVYQQLAYTAQQLDWRQLARETLTGAPNDDALEYLSDFALENDTRVLVLNPDNQGVIFDSAGIYPAGSMLQVRREQYNFARPRRFMADTQILFGGFENPDRSEWLFAGIEINFRRIHNAVLFATPRPAQSLRTVLGEFASALVLPLCQAGIVGALIALALAAFISRNIARSLQQAARAAGAVAQGNYDQRVPVSGAPEVRALAEAFNEMSAQVRQSQQSQQDFLANVSHDLKTPLTSIQGFSQAIMDGAANDPKQAAKIIHEEAGRLNRMVVQLNDLARIQAGSLSMHINPIDMGQMTQAIAQRLEIVAREKGLTLNIESPTMPEIAGDGDRLAQVLTNLISNAINYTPSGGCVNVRTQVNNGGVEIIVNDTGVGIPPADLPRIFERFYQVDKARGPRRGTGLGLAITQEIIHAHGGHISVTSAGEGKGSTFTVWLPSPQLSTVVRGRRS
jgi:signal transduction histidine kinase